MKDDAIEVLYSPLSIKGFIFHISQYIKKKGFKISMRRMRRLSNIAVHSPYPAKHLLLFVRNDCGIDVSDRVLKEDLKILEESGILIRANTNDKFLLK